MAQSFIRLADEIMFWIYQLMGFSFFFQVVIMVQLAT